MKNTPRITHKPRYNQNKRAHHETDTTRSGFEDTCHDRIREQSSTTKDESQFDTYKKGEGISATSYATHPCTCQKEGGIWDAQAHQGIERP